MDLTLSKLRCKFILVQTAALLLIVCGILTTDHVSKSSLAKSIAESQRESLLVENNRAIMRSLNPLISQDMFTGISYHLGIGRTLLSLGDASAGAIIIGQTIDVPVYFDEQKAARHGHWEFRYQINPLLGLYIALLWGLCLLISWFVFRSAQTKLESELTARRAEDHANAVSETAALLIHDLKRPFYHINMALDVLSNVEDIGALNDCLDVIRPSIDLSIASSNTLLGDLADLKSVSPNILEPTDINKLIESVVFEAVEMGRGKGITIGSDLTCKKMVHVDPRRMRMVLNNLVLNAIQAKDGDEKISIATKDVTEPKDGVFVEISNSDSAIDKNELHNIFSPLYSKGKKLGSGLGLSMVRSVILSHGGNISCTSNEPEGTKMMIWLPSNIYQEY